MAHADWYRLDNIGKFYSAEAASSRQTVFRFSAIMTDAVDENALQRALERTIERYPSFNVCLRSGLFWHYLEPAKTAVRVQPETLPVCFGLHTGPHSVLFRVVWFAERISLEVSHMISDGRGSLRFFRTLMGFYGEERYATPFEEADHGFDEERERQAEDSFGQHYDPSKSAATPSERPYRLSGPRDAALPTFLEYHLPANEVHAWAKSLGVSVTSLIIAAVICAIRAGMNPADRTRPIRLDVPVDLRQFFDSATLRNFFGLAFVSYLPGSVDEPLEAIAANVQQQIASKCTASAMEGRMNRMIGLEKNVGLRLAPLFLKDLALDAAARIAERDVTTTVSSLGRIDLPASVASHVSGVSVLTATTGLNFIACTFGNDLCVGISTVFKRLDVVRELCRLFSAQGIAGRIDLNHDATEVDRRLREAEFDERLKQLGAKGRKEEDHATL